MEFLILVSFMEYYQVCFQLYLVYILKKQYNYLTKIYGN